MTLFEMIDERIGIISFVSEEGLRINLCQKRLGLREIRCLARCQGDRNRISERVGNHMDLRRQSAPGSTNRLASLFACLRTGTMLMGAYIGGGQHHVLIVVISSKCLDIGSKTPPSHHRRIRLWTFFQPPNRSGRSRQGIPARYR